MTDRLLLVLLLLVGCYFAVAIQVSCASYHRPTWPKFWAAILIGIVWPVVSLRELRANRRRDRDRKIAARCHEQTERDWQRAKQRKPK